MKELIVLEKGIKIITIVSSFWEMYEVLNEKWRTTKNYENHIGTETLINYISKSKL